MVCLELLTVGHPARPAFNTGGTVWQPATWLDVGTTLPTDGVVVRWRLYCRVARLPVRLQIWRPMMGRHFRLIGETVVRPTAAGVFQVRKCNFLHTEISQLIQYYAKTTTCSSRSGSTYKSRLHITVMNYFFQTEKGGCDRSL